jgi:nitrate/nitrite transporter NarK
MRSWKMVNPMFVYLPAAAIIIAFVTLRTIRGHNKGMRNPGVRRLKAILRGKKIWRFM